MQVELSGGVTGSVVDREVMSTNYGIGIDMICFRHRLMSDTPEKGGYAN